MAKKFNSKLTKCQPCFFFAWAGLYPFEYALGLAAHFVTRQAPSLYKEKHGFRLIIEAHLSMLVFLLTSDMLYDYVVCPFYYWINFFPLLQIHFRIITALPKNREE